MSLRDGVRVSPRRPHSHGRTLAAVIAIAPSCRPSRPRGAPIESSYPSRRIRVALSESPYPSDYGRITLRSVSRASDVPHPPPHGADGLAMLYSIVPPHLTGNPLSLSPSPSLSLPLSLSPLPRLTHLTGNPRGRRLHSADGVAMQFPAPRRSMNAECARAHTHTYTHPCLCERV